MSKKLTKAEVKAIENSYITDPIIVPYVNGDNTINIELKPYLTLEEEATFINRVVESVFTENLEFVPMYKDSVLFATLIQMFSNFPIPTIKKDDKEVLDLVKCHDLMIKTKLFDKIYRMFNSSEDNEKEFSDYINSLEFKIDDAIEFKKQEILINQKKEQDEMANRALYQIFDSVADFKQLLKRINGIVENMDINNPKFQEVFSVAKELMSKGKLDEKTLVNEVLKVKENEVKEVKETKEGDK